MEKMESKVTRKMLLEKQKINNTWTLYVNERNKYQEEERHVQ